MPQYRWRKLPLSSVAHELLSRVARADDVTVLAGTIEKDLKLCAALNFRLAINKADHNVVDSRRVGKHVDGDIKDKLPRGNDWRDGGASERNRQFATNQQKQKVNHWLPVLLSAQGTEHQMERGATYVILRL